MNVIWITTQFPRNERDTKGIFIYRTIKELSKHYSIHAFVLRPFTVPIKQIIKNPFQIKSILSSYFSNITIQKYRTDPNNFEIVNIKYIRFFRGPLWFLEGYFAYWAAKNELKKIIKKDSIIHSNWIFPEGKLASLLKKKFKIPYILTIRGGDIQKLKVGSSNWKHSKDIINKASRVTSVSRDLLKMCGQKKIEVDKLKERITHNFYEVEKFVILNKSECRKQIGISDEDKVIFFVGGLIPRKNLPVLLKAVVELEKRIQKLKLFIAGDGIEEERLKYLTEKLGISNLVYFLGRVESETIIQYMNASDVFCLPSKSEGLPNVVVESLLCGIPVVASAVNELPYILQNGSNGYLVNPNSLDDLIESLNRCLQKEWDRKTLRESVSFLFPDSVINEYNALYEEVLGETVS